MPDSGQRATPQAPAGGFSVANFLPPGGYSFHRTMQAMGMGCVSTGTTRASIGTFGAMFTDGISVVAEAVDGCENGLVGGLIVYGITGDNSAHDSSGAEDMREYIQDTF